MSRRAGLGKFEMGRIVEILNDVTVETNCNRTWSVVSEEWSPLEALAHAADEDRERCEFSPDDGQYGYWMFECEMHKETFRMGGTCPQAYETFSIGESVVIDDQVADRLVRAGQAAYPTHKPKLEESVQATLDRANILMDQMGLPHMDEEAIKAIGARTKKVSRHYAKPKDTQLAGELGMSPSDIAEMRKLSKGD